MSHEPNWDDLLDFSKPLKKRGGWKYAEPPAPFNGRKLLLGRLLIASKGHGGYFDIDSPIVRLIGRPQTLEVHNSLGVWRLRIFGPLLIGWRIRRAP